MNQMFHAWMAKSYFCIVVSLACFSLGAAAQISSGTAFAVASGQLITNEHVVAGCSSVDVITADGRYTGSIVDADPQTDLALLRVSGVRGAVARLRSARNVRLGESVMVFGFPLTGSLTSGGNFTSGLVSGLRGLRDAAGQIQITAPVQPGNSGGPLLDASGLAVGVVQAKLDALRSAIATGDIPQNVNFAISLEVLTDFLVKNKVGFRGVASAPPMDAARVAALAQSFTYRVECRNLTQLEEKFWDDAKTTGNKEAFEAYLERYPNGRFASLARANIARLNSIVAAPAIAPPIVSQVPPSVSGSAGTLSVDDRRTDGARNDDTNIYPNAVRRIIEKLGNKAHINITSFNRKVLLTGDVPDAPTKVEVGRMIGGLENVASIVNELQVTGNSFFSARVYDSILTGKVKRNFLDDRNIFSNAFTVVTESSVVYLMGLVTREEGERAAQAASRTDGVKEVVKVFEYIPRAPNR